MDLNFLAQINNLTFNLLSQQRNGMDIPDFALSETQKSSNQINEAQTSEDDRRKTHDWCLACDKELEIKVLATLDCGDRWCTECLERAFTLALKDETAYPPRCCRYGITLKEARKYLPKSLVREFQIRQLELKTKNKTYCHKPNCSAFIAPHSIHNSEAICQKCSARTCAKCRGKWHFGPCSTGDDPEFMELASSNKWKRCPVCRRMVEKDDGCNHMLCRCGCEFCYGCAKKMNSCECTFSDEDVRLEGDMTDTDDDSVVEEETHATVMQNHRLQRHQNYQILSRRGEQFQCNLCNRLFWNWIPQCERCSLFVCNFCRQRGEMRR